MFEGAVGSAESERFGALIRGYLMYLHMTDKSIKHYEGIYIRGWGGLCVSGLFFFFFLLSQMLVIYLVQAVPCALSWRKKGGGGAIQCLLLTVHTLLTVVKRLRGGYCCSAAVICTIILYVRGGPYNGVCRDSVGWQATARIHGRTPHTVRCHLAPHACIQIRMCLLASTLTKTLPACPAGRPAFSPRLRRWLFWRRAVTYVFVYYLWGNEIVLC